MLQYIDIYTKTEPYQISVKPTLKTYTRCVNRQMFDEFMEIFTTTY
jgi:hypothetical protein